jgi:hypothetical protein
MAVDSSLSDGYFVRLGNTNDDISLYRKNGNQVLLLIDGINGVLNNTTSSIRISVTRNSHFMFTLKRAINGGAFMTEGVSSDSNIPTGNHFGILIKQSTASFFGKHQVDNILIQSILPDTIPPFVDSFRVTNERQMDIFFNEEVDSLSSQEPENFIPINFQGAIASVIKDSIVGSCLHVFLANNLPVRTNLSLIVRGLKDMAGNSCTADTLRFSIYTPKPHDIVIDEIMADPTPSVLLPECEWLEIRNTSVFDIPLGGWYLQKDGVRSGLLPEYVLHPDSIIVICSTGSYDTLKLWATCLPVINFPALSNTGDLISLMSRNHQAIHTVNYVSTWYRNVVKQNGGWTLEMTDPQNPCGGGDNWSSSIDMRGGTPGQINSTDGTFRDQIEPLITHAFAPDSLRVILFFNEPLDSLSASVINHYQFNDAQVSIMKANPISPLFEKVELVLAGPLQKNNIYKITVDGIKDCAGNTIGLLNSTDVGLAETPEPGDVVINEILFNPKSGGYDYVEIFNRSRKIINLQSLRLADHDAFNNIADISTLTDEGKLFFPNDFLVMTEGGKEISRDYFIPHPEKLILMHQMPSLNDDEGCVLLMNSLGLTIDHIQYKASQHMELLENTEGVSLERISINAASEDAGNWQSAAFTSGYGTPTYKNSQSVKQNASVDFFKLNTPVFTPDNDGLDDVWNLRYRFSDPGYFLTAKIYDLRGRLIYTPVAGLLCGIEGDFFWNGQLQNRDIIKPGYYILLVEAFNKNGKKKIGKKSFAVR